MIRTPKQLGEGFARDLVEIGAIEECDWKTAAGVIATAIIEDRLQAPREEEDTARRTHQLPAYRAIREPATQQRRHRQSKPFVPLAPTFPRKHPGRRILKHATTAAAIRAGYPGVAQTLRASLEPQYGFSRSGASWGIRVASIRRRTAAKVISPLAGSESYESDDQSSEWGACSWACSPASSRTDGTPTP
jgi:hypothetical protein